MELLCTQGTAEQSYSPIMAQFKIPTLLTTETFLQNKKITLNKLLIQADLSAETDQVSKLNALNP